MPAAGPFATVFLGFLISRFDLISPLATFASMGWVKSLSLVRTHSGNALSNDSLSAAIQLPLTWIPRATQTIRRGVAGCGEWLLLERAMFAVATAVSCAD